MSFACKQLSIFEAAKNEYYQIHINHFFGCCFLSVYKPNFMWPNNGN